MDKDKVAMFVAYVVIACAVVLFLLAMTYIFVIMVEAIRNVT